MYSPLEQFYVYTLSLSGHSSVEVFSLQLSSVGLYALLGTGILVLVRSNGLRSEPTLVGNGILEIQQVVFDTVRSFVTPGSRIYLPFMTVLLVWLTVLNLEGNIPFGSTPTTSLALTIGLSVALWIWLLITSLHLQQDLFFANFLPQGTPLLLSPILAPIELVSYSARAFSLGIRLFSNMLAGHTLLAILSGFLLKGLLGAGITVQLGCIVALLAFTLLILLELAVSVIQGYVFTVLLSSYIATSA